MVNDLSKKQVPRAKKENYDIPNENHGGYRASERSQPTENNLTNLERYKLKLKEQKSTKNLEGMEAER